MKFRNIPKMLRLLGDDRYKLPWMVLLFLLSSMLDLAGLGLILPYIALIADPEGFMQGSIYPYFVLFGFPSESNDLLFTLGYLLISVFALKTISAIFINWVILHFCFNNGVKLRSSLMTAYQSISYIKYTLRNSSEYIRNIQQLANVFSQGVLQSYLRLVSEIIVTIAVLILLAYSDFVIFSIFSFLFFVIIFFYDAIFGKKLKRYGSQINKYSKSMVQGINEGFEGFKEIKTLQKEQFFHQYVVENAKKYAHASIKSSLISMMPRYLIELILIVFLVFAVFYFLMFRNELGNLLPLISLFGLAALRLAPSVNQIVSSIARIRQGQNTVNILFDDINSLDIELNKVSTTVDQDKYTEKFENLEFLDISFSYPNAPDRVLNNMSLKICAGDSIGVVGLSGSGKSTLMDIILGLIEPTSGSIFYNSHKLVNTDITFLTSQIAYIPQDIFITDDTLRNNIALGTKSSEIDIDKIEKSLIFSRLSEVVDKLPSGVDTILGQRGRYFSGGQKQRVAIARAFYYDRNILLMDESTSALDKRTESEVVEEIQRLKGEKTIIVISHNMKVLEFCDNIYELNDGKLVKFNR